MPNDARSLAGCTAIGGRRRSSVHRPLRQVGRFSVSVKTVDGNRRSQSPWSLGPRHNWEFDQVYRLNPTSKSFLSARWESLVFLNYACLAELLEPLVPQGTVLDSWNGVVLVSLVGFLFTDTRVRGLSIPFHRTFEEVNLRFYVRRTTSTGEVRRAVVFIRELVPRRAIAAVARWVYNEPYVTVPMTHRVSLTATDGGSATYFWRHRGQPFALGAEVTGRSQRLMPHSEAEFVTEHYWGYTRQRDGGTLEYRVEHPVWQAWEANTARFSGPGAALYGPALGGVLAGPPRSAFVASGSEVVVHAGVRLAGIAG